MSRTEARNLSSKQRGELLANNPVKATIAWKRRLDAILDFIYNSKCRRLGKIPHYVVNAEWQIRCSEHAHLLNSSEDAIPDLATGVDVIGGIQLGDNFQLMSKAESFVTAWLPEMWHSCPPDTETVDDQARKRQAIQANPVDDLTRIFSKDEQAFFGTWF